MNAEMQRDRAMAYLRCGCSFEEAADATGLPVHRVMNYWHEAAKVQPPWTVGRTILAALKWAAVIIVLSFFAYAAITDTSPECPGIDCGPKVTHTHG